MREIKFRGLLHNPRAKETKWIYGDLFRTEMIGGDGEELQWFIKYFSKDCRVIPESVGEFTGLQDKNGKAGLILLKVIYNSIKDFTNQIKLEGKK